MISPDKLQYIHGGQKRRKLALCFGALERDIIGCAEQGCGYNFPSMTRQEYIRRLVEIVLEDPQLAPAEKTALEKLLQEEPLDEHRICNRARNALLAIIGTFPAEWDLIIAPHRKPASCEHVLEPKGAENAGNLWPSDEEITRDFYPNLFVYAEDIRSPFNLGSIFRTAEAMGAQGVFLSPGCCDPLHPRAVRSAMGCIEVMEWKRLALDELPNLPIFVLETGGTPLRDFVFPKEGIVIIGSEELGVSPEALAKGTYGQVTIPMKGMKASLNVGVAFGILMEAWTSYIAR